MRYVWLALLPLLACAKTALWDDPGWSNPVEVVIETSNDGQSWAVAGCQPDGQSLSVTVPDANYYRAQAIERGTAATGDCDVANAAAISAYSNVFADIAELLPYSAVTVAPVLPWATEQEPPVMAQPTVGATVSSGTDSNSPWSALPHTVDAGTNLLVVAVIGWNDPGDYMINGNNNAVSSATWTQDGESGQAMTALVAPTIGGWLYQGAREAVGYFVLANPNIGEGDIAFGSGQTPQEGVTFVAVNLKNVDLAVGSAGIRDSESNSNEGSATSAAVSSSVDDLVVAALYSYNENTITWTAGGTSLHSATFNSATANVRVFDGAETSKTISASATDYPALFVLSIAGAAGSGATASLTGQSVATVLGTLTPTGQALHALSGQSITSALGTLSATGGIAVSLSGNEIASALGALGATGAAVKALTGGAVTSALGNLSATGQGQVLLSGLATTSTLGDMAATGAATHTLSGQSITSGLGTLSASGSISVELSGLSVSSQLGTLTGTGAAAITLSGNEIASALGTVQTVGGVNITLTGMQATVSLGDVTAATTATVTLSGLQINAALGTITGTGAATVTLSGNDITSALGTLSASSGGEGALLATVTLTPALDAALTVTAPRRTS